MNTPLPQAHALAKLIWAETVPRSFVSDWCRGAQLRTVSAGEMITRQYHPAQWLYFLMDGEVEHSLQLVGQEGGFQVGGISLRGFPLGWSGLSMPQRYATAARAVTECRLLGWRIDELHEVFYRYPEQGARFYRHLLANVLNLLADARQQLRQTLPATGLLMDALRHTAPVPPSVDEGGGVAEVLAHALFFEVFPEHQLESLPGLAEIRHYGAGECIFEQGAPGANLILLLNGSVASDFRSGRQRSRIYLRSFTTAGQIIAHPELTLSGRYEETATAIAPTTVALISEAALDQLAEEQPEFGLLLAQRLLWLVSARLRTLRIQLIAQRYDQEQIAVQNLLAQVSPQLGIASKLYKLPHLLVSRITHEEAFSCLDEVKGSGTPLERTLAGVCVDVLTELRRELRFYQGLLEVYQGVTQAPLEQSPKEVRRLCSVRFQRAFAGARQVIRGQENLPAEAGHIFILNHLISHPYHTLPNGFELALDTHFVSSMILDPKYGDGGVRVVRRARGEEHGHHSYYDRLGHIYVQTAESDAEALAPEELAARRAAFNETAGRYLRDGVNLIICPEGTSKWSHESPAPFRTGAFHLAASLDPEPLIVPIAVANFDKRLKHHAFAAVVHEPFKVSERCDPYNKESLMHFVEDLQRQYCGYVEQAGALAQAQLDAAAGTTGS